MKQNQILHIIILFIFNSLNSILFSQDLKNEMFLNRNSIDKNFKLNFEIEKKFQKIKQDSIQILLKDENDSILSIYVKNNLNKSIKIIPQDNSLYLIQEAIDKNGNWNPIEFWGFSHCGNSYENHIEFKPKQILKLKTDKYSGDYKTKSRIKIQLNNKIYYSNPINSYINYSKFEKSKWYSEIQKMYYSNKSEIEAENILFLKSNF